MTENNLHLALYFLEILYSKGPLPLGVVAEIYQNKMLSQKPMSYDNLVKETILFLKQYPSLFENDTEFVFPVSSDTSCHSEPLPNSKFHSVHLNNQRSTSIDETDISQELEAVKYFQNNLLRKEEKWVPIKSLAGHLSQATENVRIVIGSQSQFTSFLLRHSHIFEVQGELVGLKDKILSLKSGWNLANGKKKPKKNQNYDCQNEDTNSSDSSKSSRTNNIKRLSKNCKTDQSITNFLISNGPRMLKSDSDINQNSVSVALAANDYKTIMALHTIINSMEKSSVECNLANLMTNILRNPHNNIVTIVGLTQIELEEYLNRHALFFDILEGKVVKTRNISNVNIVINENSSCSDVENLTLCNKEGSVYHIAKLWGIIDLGQHEHVFFDKSIFKNIDNLERYFQIGEKIYFNAVLASKNSRAKWRATRVWKDVDNPILQTDISLKSSLDGNISSSTSPPLLMDEIDFSDFDLGNDFGSESGKQTNQTSSQLLISSPVNNGWEKLDGSDLPNGDGHEQRNLQIGKDDSSSMSKTYSRSRDGNRSQDPIGNCDMGTQTLSTGEIMAMHFYHDETAAFSSL